jgi:hypothetical protein
VPEDRSDLRLDQFQDDAFTVGVSDAHESLCQRTARRLDAYRFVADQGTQQRRQHPGARVLRVSRGNGESEHCVEFDAAVAQYAGQSIAGDVPGWDGV